MAFTYPSWLGRIFVLMGLVGCGGTQEPVDLRQADIGFGIVEGTKGFRQIQKEALSPKGSLRVVEGQVFQIEGAAYVVHINDQIEARLPFDENTRIDRPAHVGDWIEAQLDREGRARIIRNIDDRISLE
ncbi:MAG: hypothetical protein NPIRA06_06530 [Nitrospirales bacterium]|nr:MAG: hypothetical protein NPIRA06_06530 [Nitrospirales bacterium]